MSIMLGWSVAVAVAHHFKLIKYIELKIFQFEHIKV